MSYMNMSFKEDTRLVCDVTSTNSPKYLFFIPRMEFYTMFVKLHKDSDYREQFESAIAEGIKKYVAENGWPVWASDGNRIKEGRKRFWTHEVLGYVDYDFIIRYCGWYYNYSSIKLEEYVKTDQFYHKMLKRLRDKHDIDIWCLPRKKTSLKEHLKVACQ